MEQGQGAGPGTRARDQGQGQKPGAPGTRAKDQDRHGLEQDDRFLASAWGSVCCLVGGGSARSCPRLENPAI
jgi:hypothetical protein